jgi:hypothetical protein
MLKDNILELIGSIVTMLPDRAERYFSTALHRFQGKKRWAEVRRKGGSKKTSAQNPLFNTTPISDRKFALSGLFQLSRSTLAAKGNI